MKNIINYFNEEAKFHDDLSLNKMGMLQFYDEIEKQLNKCINNQSILILGCGTGLEIERIKFKTHVVAIDISKEMLVELSKKTFYKSMSLDTICSSILDHDFGFESFDIVLTCYTLHHFSVQQKEEIYHKIYSSLRPNGVFINGDVISNSLEEEFQRINSAENIYSSEKLPFGSLHIDVPLTYKREISLLNAVGFHQISLEREWTNSILFRCVK